MKKLLVLGVGVVSLFCALAALLSLRTSFVQQGLFCVVPTNLFWLWVLPVFCVCCLYWYHRLTPSYFSTALLVVSLSWFAALIGDYYGRLFIAAVVLVLCAGVCVTYTFWVREHRDWCYVAAIVFLLVAGLLVYAGTATQLRFLPEHCVYGDGVACVGFSVEAGSPSFLRVALPPGRSAVDASDVSVHVADESLYCPGTLEAYRDVCSLVAHDSFVELRCSLPVAAVVDEPFTAYLVFGDGAELSLRALPQ